MVNNKIFEHRPVDELFAIVKGDLRSLADEGLIDEGPLLKTVHHCNAKLGLYLQEIKEVCIPIIDHQGILPKDFERVYYVALTKKVTKEQYSMFNPLLALPNNYVDGDVIYDTTVKAGIFGCDQQNYVKVERQNNVTVFNIDNLNPIGILGKTPYQAGCPNVGKHRSTIQITDEGINTSFKDGLIYMMYVATMQDEEGNLLYNHHPLITPYYEWSLKEKVIIDAVFNSDATDLGPKLELARSEKIKAWLDAYDLSTNRTFMEELKRIKKRELNWYKEHFQKILGYGITPVQRGRSQSTRYSC